MRLIKVGYVSLFALAIALTLAAMWISTQYGSSPIKEIIIGLDGTVTVIENPYFKWLVAIYPTVLFLVLFASFLVANDKESMIVKTLTALSVKMDKKS